MAVVRLDALCACDGCQKRFSVEIDLSRFPSEFDLDYLVKEEVRGGQGTYFTWGVRGKHTVDRLPLPNQPTIQAGFLLCDACSEQCDVPGWFGR